MNRSGTHSGRKEPRGRLIAPRRNRFFHGKRMDAYHFELETGYGMAMRRMINRMVFGGGVVCGLDVTPGHEPCSVVISAGLAIDGWGREIVVPETSAPFAIPPSVIKRVCGENGNGNGYGGEGKPPDDAGYADAMEASGQAVRRGEQSPEQRGEPGRSGGTIGKGDRERGREQEREPACVTVFLCYHECESDPVQVLAGECGAGAPCAPGSIREQYALEFDAGCQDPYDPSCRFPDVLRGGELDYAELARFVTRGCPDPPRTPCVPLANLHLECRDGSCDLDAGNIDITIRPVVFANAILFDLLSRIVEEEQASGRWGR